VPLAESEAEAATLEVSVHWVGKGPGGDEGGEGGKCAVM